MCPAEVYGKGGEACDLDDYCVLYGIADEIITDLFFA